MDRDFGKDSNCGACFVCQMKIYRDNCHMGHIEADRHGGAVSMSNLKAICHNCNLSMGTQNMLEFKAVLPCTKRGAKTSIPGATHAATRILSVNTSWCEEKFMLSLIPNRVSVSKRVQEQY